MSDEINRIRYTKAECVRCQMHLMFECCVVHIDYLISKVDFLHILMSSKGIMILKTISYMKKLIVFTSHFQFSLSGLIRETFLQKPNVYTYRPADPQQWPSHRGRSRHIGRVF